MEDCGEEVVAIVGAIIDGEDTSGGEVVGELGEGG